MYTCVYACASVPALLYTHRDRYTRTHTLTYQHPTHPNHETKFQVALFESIRPLFTNKQLIVVANKTDVVKCVLFIDSLLYMYMRTLYVDVYVYGNRATPF
jgi:hypothetical protein